MSDLNGLKENLTAQCAIHKRLLAIEEEKTGVLISGDSQALLPLLNEQQALLMQSKELENRRNAAYIQPQYPMLRDLIQANEENQAILGPVFQELSTVVAALKKKSVRNKKLLDARLSTIRFLLGQTGPEQGANTYKKSIHTKG